jgi:hypothetical protein
VEKNIIKKREVKGRVNLFKENYFIKKTILLRKVVENRKSKKSLSETLKKFKMISSFNYIDIPII